MYKLVIFILTLLFVFSCETKTTLQKYYVEKTESSEFVSVDLAPSIINTGKIKLTSEEKAAIQSFDKMNILAFKSDSTQLEKYNKEISEVKSILKDDSYQQLMKAGSGSDGAAIYFVGNDDEHIEEFVVLAGKKENGFAVVRVLGNDMNPTHIMNMLTLLQKSNVDLEQLKPLQQLMK
jgi:hypothetical protein